MKLSLEVELDGADVLGKVARAAVAKALEAAGWNVSAAAGLLGLHRQSLQRMMRRHQIERPREIPEPCDRPPTGNPPPSCFPDCPEEATQL